MSKYDGFICSQTNKPCDLGVCNVMIDIVCNGLDRSFAPTEYTSHPDFKERCKNCKVYKEA